MLAITNVDVFVLMNGVMQRYPRKKHPRVYYGLSAYFATPLAQRGHALVLDASTMFDGVSPAPSRAVDDDGVINWEVLDAYLDTNPKKLPTYTWKRTNLIDAMLTKAEENDKHALSAMLSNFTPASRPAVKVIVIQFLLDPKWKTFSLPPALEPKRGRGVEYYRAAQAADFSELKEDILRDDKELKDKYEARYWRRVIQKLGKLDGGKK